MILGFRN